MTIDAWLRAATKNLKTAGLATARLDALVLLEDTTKRDRAWLLAHSETTVTAKQQKILDSQLTRRLEHLPLAYIRHKSEFYGRQFYVDERVLEPRPESETIIDLLKQLVIPASELETSQKKAAKSTQSVLGPSFRWDDNSKLTIVDVGTGSGALAITAKLDFPETEVIAIDIDPNCLAVAQKNAQIHDAQITLLPGNLLQPLRHTKYVTRNTILLCNLPYVPKDFQINTAATHEPRLAIFGGQDGLDYYRQLFEQIDSLDSKPSYILTESLPPQHQALAQIATRHNYWQFIEDDFIQAFQPL